METVDHMVAVTGGDVAGARRRPGEVDALIPDIAADPTSAGAFPGRRRPGSCVMADGGGIPRWCSGPTWKAGVLRMAIVASGGRDWMTEAGGWRAFP